MFDKLDFIVKKYSDLSLQASDPDVLSNQPVWQKIVKEMGELEPMVKSYKEYKQLKGELADTLEMLNAGGLDNDEKEMFKAELSELESRLPVIEEELKVLLLPKDPNDDKNILLEIRAGTGGDEASLFGGDLLRMYMRYAERRGYKTEMIEHDENGMGGLKEAIVLIKGKGAYSRLKYESGVHRVQRVPETESSGRVHTSAATVAVLPEVDDVDIQIDPNDVRVDVFRSSGNGGQSVNTTDSAVRLTHEPTGLVVSCQDEKSQIKNKDKAFKVLRSRLYDLKLQEQNKEISAARKSMVGSGDRSERIRTYNFPQGRISDHRIGLTLYKLDNFMDGDLDEVIDALITNDQAEKMSAGMEE
ncbi:MAG: peptide chain release factor 1 [Clostridiales Family XIII bacterium]|jgi:peptide chain release factor 1|nr:peptide chain release factor 1 [Clostridiales Family XIII bacterium]